MPKSPAERSQFTFYRSFFESILTLPKSRRLQAFEAICRYGLDGEEPEELTGASAALFLLARPVLASGRMKAGTRKKELSLGEDTDDVSDAGENKKENKYKNKNKKENEDKEERENKTETENKQEEENEREGALPVRPASAALRPDPGPAAQPKAFSVLPSEKKTNSFSSDLPPERKAGASSAGLPVEKTSAPSSAARTLAELCATPEPSLSDEEVLQELREGGEPLDLISRSDPELGYVISDWIYERCKLGSAPTPRQRRELFDRLLSLPREKRIADVEQAIRRLNSAWLPMPGVPRPYDSA